MIRCSGRVKSESRRRSGKNMSSWFLRTIAILSVASCGGDIGVAIYNEAPNVVINQPSEGALFNEGDPINFVGVVYDDRDAIDLVVTWSSSLEGELPDTTPPDPDGNISLVTSSLLDGVHVITLLAIDASGEQGSDSVEIDIGNVVDLPGIQVVHPTLDERGMHDLDAR